MVDSNGLIDLGFSGYAYTWSNKRVGKDNIQEQLDRCFANGEWRTLYPSACISHLIAIHSDHRPILINTSPRTPSRPRPFRFEEMWTRDESTASIIHVAWSKGFPSPNLAHFMTKLKSTKIALKAWNRKIFSHLSTKIQ